MVYVYQRGVLCFEKRHTFNSVIVEAERLSMVTRITSLALAPLSLSEWASTMAPSICSALFGNCSRMVREWFGNCSRWFGATDQGGMNRSSEAMGCQYTRAEWGSQRPYRGIDCLLDRRHVGKCCDSIAGQLGPSLKNEGRARVKARTR
jgi:hypothetical protein